VTGHNPEKMKITRN
jgi:hypothetical protein